jgi:hypothetical protein
VRFRATPPRALLAALALAAALATAALAGAYEDAAQAFERAMKGGDYRAQTDAVARLLETGDPRAVDLVIDRALTAEDQFVYERALEMLREKTDAAGKERVARAAQKHAKVDVRVALVRLCGSLETPAAVEAIVGALSDKDWMVQAAGIKAAREKRAVETIPPLVALTALADGRVKRDAVDALVDLTGADYGGDGAKWRAWWESARDGFTPKPPPRRSDGGDEEAKPAASVDVGTAVRDGFYEIRSKRTLFIVDLSASMEARTEKGSRLDVTKKELARAIENLGDDMLFNIVVFGDKAQLWKTKMVPASSGNRSAAKRLVQGSKADGMTATYDALKLAFSLTDVDTIWLLSDGFPTKGAVTSEALIQSDVRKWNRGKGIAIHTIAFVAGTLKGENEDKERAKTFMRELAAENGGSCKVVE